MIDFSIPLSDAAYFASLPDSIKLEVRAWQEALAVACRAKQIGVALAAVAKGLGCSHQTARRKYDAVRAHGWKALINHAKIPADRIGLPAEFVAAWKTLCEQHQRKMAPAHRHLGKLYRSAEQRVHRWGVDGFPGYSGIPPVHGATDLPKGWSYDNLTRHFKPTSFELETMRQGLGSALLKYGPQVLTTRVGLWVGSHYLIDDLTRDMKLLMLGKGGQIVRPMELGILDLYSGDRFAVHRRPQFIRADGCKDGLKESEMRYLLASEFRTSGYSRRGTEIVAEKGTAAVRRKLAAWLHDATSGAVTVREPGNIGRVQAIAGWTGKGGGNPRHKARLESQHNYAQNEADGLPAPTGHDRKPPEWLHGVEAATEGILRLMATLAPDRAAMLRVGMLEYWQGLNLLCQIDEEIAWRTDHDLEGWEECGHTTVEMRREPQSSEWLTAEQVITLPEADQALWLAAAHGDKNCRRSRRLAPREVFSKGAKDLVTLPDHVIALLFCDKDLGDDLRRPKSLTRQGRFELQDKTIEPDEMIFEGRAIQAADGSRLILSERETYQVVLNPFDRGQLWVFRGGGEYIGCAPRIYRAGMLDARAIQGQLFSRSQEISQLLTPLRERHAGAAQLIEEIQEHNSRVASGKAVTEEEIAEERRNARKDRRRVQGDNAFTDPAAKSPEILGDNAFL